MKIEDIQSRDEEKQKVINLLQRPDVMSFCFVADLDDQLEDRDGNPQTTMEYYFFADSAKEAIGLVELLKVKLLALLLRNDKPRQDNE